MSGSATVTVEALSSFRLAGGTGQVAVTAGETFQLGASIAGLLTTLGLVQEIATSSSGGSSTPPLTPLTIEVNMSFGGGTSEQFYDDLGGVSTRFAGRTLIGAAAGNPGTSGNGTPTDWLTTLAGWPVYTAQDASIAHYGNVARLGASRTSDAVGKIPGEGSVPSSIGVMGLAVNDDTTSPTTTTAYAFYGEAWRLAGANYQPAFCVEIDAINQGGAVVGSSTPYSPDVGGGVYGVWAASGGGRPNVSMAESAFSVINNGATWRTGVVVGATALAGTDGNDGGYAAAVLLAANQAIEWSTPETVGGIQGVNAGAFLRSTVKQSANATRLEFTDEGLWVSNGQGELQMTVPPVANAGSYVQVLAGANGGAAGIYAVGAVSNLILQPGSGGNIQTTAPTQSTANAGTASALPAQPAAYMPITVNGTAYKIPLYLP